MKLIRASEIKEFYSGKNVTGLKTGDLNNDGLTDIATCHWNSDYIRVFFQQKTGGYEHKDFVNTSGGRDQIEIADLNNDGLNDMIFMPGGMQHSTLQIFYQNKTDKLFDPAWIYKNATEYYPAFGGICIGDMNNDGLLDIIGSRSFSTEILYQTKTKQIGDSVEIIDDGLGRNAVRVADLNCDGRLDIILNGAYHYQNDDKSAEHFTTVDIVPSAHSPYSVGVGDINSDNQPDFICATNTSMWWYYNQSIPTSFSQIDTIVAQKTTHVRTNYDTITSKYTLIDSTEECALKKTYTKSIFNEHITNEISGDSLFVRHAQFCSRDYIDSITIKFTYQDTLTKRDSTLVLVSTKPYSENVIYSHDSQTLDTVAHSFYTDTSIVNVESYATDNGVLFKLNTTYSVINLNESYEVKGYNVSVYKGNACGIIVYDTIVRTKIWYKSSSTIKSDSVLINQIKEPFSLSNSSDMKQANDSHTHVVYVSGKTLHINLSDQLFYGADLQLVSIDGRCALYSKIVSNNTSVNLPQLQPGLYMVIIEHQDGVYSEIILIE